MWQAASKLYIGMDALWVNLVREKLGEKTAMEMGHRDMAEKGSRGKLKRGLFNLNRALVCLGAGTRGKGPRDSITLGPRYQA